MDIENDTIIEERVRILFERSFFSNITAIAASFIFAYIMRDQLDGLVIYSWLGFMITVAFFRFWIIFDYKKNSNNTVNNFRYENWFASATGLVGLGWAIIIAIGLNSELFEYRLYTVLLLVAIISIAVNIFSTSVKTLYFYLLPPLIISIPMLLAKGGNESAIGVAVIVFSLMALRSSKDISHTLNDTLHLRTQSKILFDKLKKLEHEKSSTEKRMQSIMDYSPAAIYVKDLDGCFVFLNNKVANLHNMHHDEMIGKKLHDILPENIADEIRTNDLEVINTKKTIKFEESAPHGNELRHYISIKFPMFNDENEICGVGGISTDITERVKIENSLNISQQRLILHREQSPLGVIEWNTDFEFLDWNPAAEKIFGFTKAEVEGKHITRRILPESAREEVDEVWKRLITNTGGKYSLNENITKDGRVILCEWHNTPLIDHDGNVIGVTSFVEDITERKRHEDNIRHTQKMDAIGKLTGGIAHDFNNMLGVILGFSQLLKAKFNKDDVKQIKYCEQILHAGENAKKLTTKLLQFSRSGTSSSEITDITTLVEGMRHMLEKTLTARIKLKLDVKDNISPVWIDKSQLEDSILNMSINAMHAMPDGGTLTVQTDDVSISKLEGHELDILSGDYVLLSISDSGTGMTAEVQEKIFDPFFSTKDEGGTGLGMSQVYGFVKQSGGAIKIDSELNHGSRISIYIPQYKEVETKETKVKPVSIEKLQTGNESILIVDDEPALNELNEEILSHYGYKVYCAESVENALNILKTESIDLVLSDVIMPDKNGYQLAEEVSRRYPKVKIQMISGFIDERNLNIKNPDWHENRLHKPVSHEKLLSRVRELFDAGDN